MNTTNVMYAGNLVIKSRSLHTWRSKTF